MKILHPSPSPKESIHDLNLLCLEGHHYIYYGNYRPLNYYGPCDCKIDNTLKKK